MEWLLVAWFVTGINVGTGVDSHIVTTRTNTQAACERVLKEGYKSGLRGVCVYDPASK
jgi:hypothetical protein